MELVQFFQKFSTEETCYAYLERVMWQDGRVCPKCGVIGESWRLKSKPHYYGGKTVTAYGIDAIEAGLVIKRALWEGDRRLRYKRGVWWFHNLLAHPLMQILAWCGYGKEGVRLHDASTPTPRDHR